MKMQSNMKLSWKAIYHSTHFYSCCTENWQAPQTVYYNKLKYCIHLLTLSRDLDLCLFLSTTMKSLRLIICSSPSPNFTCTFLTSSLSPLCTPITSPCCQEKSFFSAHTYVPLLILLSPFSFFLYLLAGTDSKIFLISLSIRVGILGKTVW